LITTHPDMSGLWDRLAARQKGTTPDAMVNSGACRQLAQLGRARLQQRLAEEHKGQAGKSN
jgi:hypothetical protein